MHVPLVKYLFHSSYDVTAGHCLVLEGIGKHIGFYDVQILIKNKL